MELHKIILRGLLAYIFLLILLRLSGKRTVAEGTSFDFVLALILGDMIDDALWAEVPFSQFIVATSTLIVINIAASMAGYASKTVAWLLEGEPRIIMRDGKLLRPALRRERINEKEAAEMMRVKELERERWAEVKSARVETSGRTSVIKHDWAKTVEKRDLDKLKEVKE
ncbi:MAG TPA: YetF domain-containing protein [Blastocatellia bacterium]|nr:YetF domain-containing protein [Blastocatellia bacterium]